MSIYSKARKLYCGFHADCMTLYAHASAFNLNFTLSIWVEESGVFNPFFSNLHYFLGLRVPATQTSSLCMSHGKRLSGSCWLHNLKGGFAWLFTSQLWCNLYGFRPQHPELSRAQRLIGQQNSMIIIFCVLVSYQTHNVHTRMRNIDQQEREIRGHSKRWTRGKSAWTTL